MGKCYCDYCDVFLTNDSVTVRKQHNDGNRHKHNVCEYYRQYVGHQLQQQIDDLVAQFELDVARGLIRPTYGMPPTAKKTAPPPPPPPPDAKAQSPASLQPPVKTSPRSPAPVPPRDAAQRADNASDARERAAASPAREARVATPSPRVPDPAPRSAASTPS